MLGDEDKVIAENNKCQFAVNSWTKGAEDYAAKTWGLKLRCLLAIQKSDPTDKEYILVVGNEIVFASKGYESIAAHIDMLAMSEGKKKLIGW